MAGSPSITAFLKDLRSGISQLKTETRDAAARVRELGENLKIDPSNVQLVKDRFKALNDQLESNQKLADKYRQAMSNIEKQLSQLTGTDEKTKQAQERLNSEYEKYRIQLERTTSTIKSLEAATSKETQVAMTMNAVHERAGELFDWVQEKAETVSRVVLSVASSFQRLAADVIDTSTELTALSKRYDTSVEEIQIWNNALQLATKQSDVYTQSLNTMVKGMSQVASGRGVAFQTALRGIGLSYRELSSLSTSEQFERIVEALSQITDQAERLDYAQQLLGESGQAIAGIFNQEGASIEDYLEQAKELDVISNSTAESLSNTSLQLDFFKQELQAASGEVLVAILPLLESFVDILEKSVIPILNGVGKFLANHETITKWLITLAGILIILPKIIGVTKLFFTVFKAGSAVFSVGGLKMIAIIAGIAAALMAVLGLMSLFSDRAKETLDSVNSTAAAITGMNAAAEQTAENTTIMTESATTKDVRIGVDINAAGDTPVSDANAKKVADITVDEIQKALGGLIG